MKNEVRVVSLDKRFKPLERGIEKAAHFFLEKIGDEPVCLDIYLIGNVRMRKLNIEYLGRDCSTNVLSFNTPVEFPKIKAEHGCLGEIYLNPPYIKKHKERLNYMLLHGILHIFGFNHENKSDRIRMEKLEDKLMQWLDHKS
jgi:probable rRNA maturation factor